MTVKRKRGQGFGGPCFNYNIKRDHAPSFSAPKLASFFETETGFLAPSAVNCT